MKFIDFINENRSALIKNEKTLQELCQNHDIQVGSSCGGNGTCGTCRVIVEDFGERVPPRNEIEKEFAQDRGLSDKERLSCQIPPVGGMKIKVP